MEVITEPALWPNFLAIAGLWLATVVSPGPNFLLTAQISLSRSRRAGLWASGGIAVGTTLWAGASLLGLAVLFQTASWLYLAVKLAGAAYLVGLGLWMIVDAFRQKPLGSTQSAALSEAGLSEAGLSKSGLSNAGLGDEQAFRRGLLTDLSNPKAAVFFASLFAVALPPGAPLWFDLLAVATVVITAGGWYALVACLVSRPPMARVYRRFAKAVSALAGGLFMAMGLRLALSRE